MISFLFSIPNIFSLIIKSAKRKCWKHRMELCILNTGCHSTCSWCYGAHTACTLESNQCIIEDQAFSRRMNSIGSFTFSSQQVVSLFQSSCGSSVELTDERGGGWKEPNHTTPRKPGPLQSIAYSLLGIKHVSIGSWFHMLAYRAQQGQEGPTGLRLRQV
jgi:hypothetical protein